MPRTPVSSTTSSSFWKIWNRLIRPTDSGGGPRTPKFLDAFELEERILLSATPAPTEQSSNNTASQTSTNTSTNTTQSSSTNSTQSANGSNSSTQGVSVVLIDTHLKDSGLLVQSVPKDAQLFLYNSQYDAAHDVLSRVANWAESTGHKISNLSILGQGGGDTFQLGSDWISNSTLDSVTSDWTRLAQSMTSHSKIDLFGGLINSHSGSGQQLLDQIAQLTGADVFASTNSTGKGGDWRLEASSTGSTSQFGDQDNLLNDSVLARYSRSLNADPGSAPEADSRSQIVFVDTSVADVQDLIRNVSDDTEIIFIDSTRDGMDQMAQALAGRQNVTSIAILSHGTDARLLLGTSNLTLESLQSRYAEDWAIIADSLGPNAQILLYGCDIAEFEDGRSLIDAIALTTKASVAASTNLTGSALQQGDWNLEYSTGTISDQQLKNALSSSNWDYLLATATFQQGTSGYSGMTDTMIDASATLANNGSGLTINASLLGTTQDLVKFDLSSIPAGSTITGVQLSFTSAASIGLLPSVNLYKMLVPWNSAANWNSFGGGGAPRDNVTASSSSDDSWGALLSIGGTATFSSANMVSTVQSWVNNSSSNNGWLIVGGGLASVSFHSSDAASAANRPVLTVTYTAPTAPSVDLDANNNSGATGNNFNTAFTQHGAAIKVADTDGAVTAGSNSISPNLSGMTLTISNLLDGTAESLSATTTGTSITASYNSATGVLTLSGADTAAHYQTVLRTVTYNNTADDISTASRIINVVATDPYGGNSATATATVSIIANASPTITNGASVVLTGTNEDTTSSGTTVNSILASAGWSDADGGAAKGIAITAKVGNGTWQYSTDGTTWASFGSVSSSNALLLTSTTQVRYVPDGQNGETATFSFMAWDQTTGTASTNSSASYSNPSPRGGTTAYSSQSASATMTVTSVNDAPTMTNGTNVTLTAINEDTTSSTTTVNSLLTSANWNDVDTGAVKGIAVTSKSGNGTWQYSTNGTTWANFGAVSASSSLLLTSSTQVRYIPDGQNGETASFSYVAWDQTTGTASTNGTPSYANSSSGGGTSAYSSQSASASLSVTSVNDAPTLTNGSVVTLTGTNEDATSPSATINSILTSAGWSDVDTGAVKGVAISSVTGNGTWQYSTDGITWSSFGSVSATNALLLTSGTQVRYIPDSQNGETATFTFVAWDQTTGTASTNSTASYANPSPNGGTTAYSSQSASATMTVTSVNDAPTITNGTTVTLTGTNEDTTSSSTTVNALLTTANWNDGDTGAVKGIAITSKSGNGTWQYSTDGTTWANFGTVSSTSSLLLTSTTQVRYIPDSQNGETATFTYVAWDQTTGTASTNGAPSYANSSTGGGTSAYSSQSATASILVSSVNDAPTLVNATVVSLTGTNEDATSPATTVNSILSSASWADVDSGALKGIAVTSKSGNGTWQYSTDGVTWSAFGSVSASNALLLTSGSQVRYIPDGLNGESASFGFVAWDQTTGTASTNATPHYAVPGAGGGTSAFSSQSASASMTITSVNDAPTITSGATVTLTGTNEDTTSSTTTVNSILTTVNWADVDSGAIKGIAVTGKSGNGTWQYSTDGTTWTSFGSVSATNALLLTSATQLRYVPDSQNGETANLIFVAWDQTTGTASVNGTPGYANPGSGGGTTAFSSQSASASITVTSVNDAPTISNGATVLLTGTNETTTSTGTTVNSILSSSAWSDVDTGALKGIAISAKTGNGTWQYSTDGTTWANVGSVSATNALLLTSSTQVRYVPDGQNGETATFSFVAWDQSAGTSSTNALPSFTNPGSGGGTSAFSSQTANASITISDLNNAPSITNGAVVTLSATDEDTVSSATSVNSILTSANWVDVDSGAVKGIAITGKVGNGTWQYSTDGTTWTSFGNVSATNALLLTSSSQVRYSPDSQNGETATFSFVAWDQTSGTPSIGGSPSYTNPGAGGGPSTFSSQSASASMTVTSVNDAPTISNGSTVTLTSTNEDTTSTTTTVNSILTSAGWTDVDTSAIKGIAITGKVGNGTWQYSTDGTTWSSFGAVSSSNALLVTSTTQIRYVPDGQNGETATFSFVAWDQTTGTASTSGTPRYANPGAGGGTMAFSSQSATASMTVASVNDAPTITNGTTVTLTGTNEDTTSTATTVDSLLTTASWADVDSSALKGIAITNKSGNGTWQYSTDGTTWTSFGTVSSSSALLITSASQVRYIPDGNNGETATFSYVAWDQSTGTASTNGTARYANPGSGGGATAYSSQSAMASLAVASINDAPTITNGTTVTFPSTDEKTTSSATTVNSILSTANWNDVDIGALKGIAVTAATGNGSWQYSTDGSTWTNFGPASLNNALLFSASTQIRYVPDNHNGETATFSFVAWDQSTGTASVNGTPSTGDATTQGGSAGFSSQSGSASITVTSINDSPTLTNGAVVTLTATDEDTTSASTTINTILTSSGWTDPDNSGLKGVAITAKVGNGTWQYSTDGTTWANFGSVTSTNALLLTSTTQVRYVPDGKNGETATFSFVAWDQSSGTASTISTASYANPGSGGGTSAYSAQSASTSMVVSSVNDAPTITNGITITLTGTNEDTTSSAISVFSILTTANWADVDTGAVRGIAITASSGNGNWQYSTDGTTWTNVGATSTASSLLLTSTSQLRYVPDGQNGETATFTFAAWDRTTGSASATGSPSYADTTTRGGASAFSASSGTGSITVTSVNDAPTITNGAVVTLSATNEDTTSTPVTVSSLLTSANWTDVDSGALSGIAITGKTGNGTWQYSTDGTTWSSFGATSSASALLLTSGTQVRYVPDGQNGETATLSFVAWDQTTGTASTNGTPRYANPSSGGSTTAFSAQLATASLSVTSVNDAPTIANGTIIPLIGTDLLTISSTTSVNTLLSAANWADVDLGAQKGIAVTSQTGHGDWQYSTDGVIWKNFGAVSTSNALLLTSTTQIRYQPDGLSIELPKITFTAWDQSTGTASTSSTASYGNATTRGGTTAYSSQTASASMIISLLSGQSVTLPGTDEDTPSPGTSANWILSQASWSLLNISLLSGMAITDFVGNGTWQYSTNGTTWTNMGSVSDTHALVIGSSTQVRYLPDGQNGETAGFVFQSWSELSGPSSSNSTPRYQDTTINLLNFSSQSSTASIVVTSVNDAPTLANGSFTLPGTNEDSTSPVMTVDSFLSSAGWSDIDIGALTGIALTGMTGNGTWQYSTDGIQWTAISGISTTNALLLDALTQIRYVPDGLNGETSTLTFVAWDRSLGTSSTSATPRYASAFSRGGTTAYSTNDSTASMSVSSVNDAPTINNGSIGSIGSTNQFTDSAGVSADSVLTAASWADSDTGALKGVAITGTSGNGIWQYSTDGLTWTNFGNVSSTNALLLTASTLIHYVPDGTNSETANLDFVAWDQSSGVASADGFPSYSDASTGGGTSAFSSQIASASITVTAINRAPTITNGGSVTFTSTDEDTPSQFNTVASLLAAMGYNDPDGGSSQGIAVTGQTGNGIWQYSSDGTTWTNFGATTTGNSLLLDSNMLVRYMPDKQNGETASFQFVAWDETSGSASSDGTPSYADTTANGGTSAFSTQSGSGTIVVTSVNDAPTIVNGAIVTLSGTDEDTPSAGTSVDAILTSANWLDVDTSALKGIGIVGVTGSGTWQYSTDGTTWTNVGSVASNNALLVSSTSQIRYVPNGQNGETATFSFIAWDQTSGTASSNGSPSYTSSSIRGGTSAYSSQCSTATMTITSVNDAPSITNGALIDLPGTNQTTPSVATSVDSIVTSANWSDIDTGAVKGIAITSASGYGTWQYSTDGTTWTNFGAVSSANSLLLSSNAEIRYLPDGSHAETANFQFVAWDQSAGATSSTGSPSYADSQTRGGATAYSSQVATARSIVDSVNYAPTITNGSSVVMTGTDEDTPSTPITIDSLLTSASWADTNAGAVKGMAITGASGNGSWQYSTDGLTWTNFGTVSSSNALLLASGTSIRYAPDEMNGETAAMQFVAWDQTSGSASSNSIPSYAATTTSGGNTAYSAGVASATITVTSLNDAPTLTNGTTVTLSGTDENTTSSSTSVGSILTSVSTHDVDTGAAYGMAITSASGYGTWQYSTDGTTWTNFGPVSSASALLLDASSLVRYVPDGSHSESPSFAFVAWDQSTGTASANSSPSHADASVSGGTSSYSSQSATAKLTVAPLNHSPSMTNGATVGLASTNEDTASSPTTVASLLTSANATDSDTGSLSGMAVTSTSGNGTWQYSTDGTTWTDFGTVSTSNALLLDSTTQVRYMPDEKNGESASFQFAAWDQTTGSASTNATSNHGDTTTSGGNNAYSTQRASATITITSVNDAPTLTNGATVSLPATNEDTTSSATSVSTLLAAANAADVDTGAVLGMAVTSVNGYGTWQYSTNGTTWTNFGSVSSTNALLLTASTQIRYVPDGMNGETASLTFVAWDQSTGTASTNATPGYASAAASGGTTAFSSQSAAATISVTSVNDAPTLSNGTTVPLPTTNEDTTSAATMVGSILGLAGDHDSDLGSPLGMAVTSTTGNGKWQYSTDGTTWNDFGTVSSSSALLLDGSSQVRYVPDGKNGEVANFQFVAWDHSTGTASTNSTASYGNSTAGGGTSAYSTQSATTSMTVTSVNDAPSITDGAVVTLPSTDRVTMSSSTAVDPILTAANWSDPDTGALKGIAITGQTGHGKWQYSTNGTTWSNFGAVSTSNALLITSAALIRYVPDGVTVENATFSFVAWDQSAGSASTNTLRNYGDTSSSLIASSFSSETATTTITVNYVNSAPSMNSTTITLTGTTDKLMSDATLVDTLLIAVNFSDDGPGGLRGIAVTSATGAGSWKYSTDGVTWTSFGTVSRVHALLLASNHWIAYVPQSSVAEQASFTFQGWDQSSGVASTASTPSFANPGNGGGTTAFTVFEQTSTAMIGVSTDGTSIITPPTTTPIPGSNSNGNPNDHNNGVPTIQDLIKNPKEISGSNGNGGSSTTTVLTYTGSSGNHNDPSNGLSIIVSSGDDPWNSFGSTYGSANAGVISSRIADTNRAGGNQNRGANVITVSADPSGEDADGNWVPVVHHPVVVARVDGQKGLSTSLILGSTTTVSSTLSAGYVLWLLRGGSIWGGMVSLVGTWSTIDPLPILESAAAASDKEKEDQETLESLIASGQMSIKTSNSDS